MSINKAENSKDFILQTAFALFLANGYKDVTLKNITEATNFSKGAIYHHFESKEEIFHETIRAYYLNMLEHDSLKEPTGNFVQDITRLYSAVSDLFSDIENIGTPKIEYPIRSFINFKLESETHAQIVPDILKSSVQYRKDILNIVQNAVDTKQIKAPKDIEALSFQIIGMIEGIILNHSILKSNVKEILKNKYEIIFQELFSNICLKN